ncbi:MAG: universal stress protein [Candidatus Palauibacterales bacterium]|nr:universal stress protein [Candidatus Palauibacterales bacterium]
MYRELLVPVDNSQHSDWAVDRAIEIADRFDGHLTASHVYAARLHDVRFRQLEVGLPARFQDPEEIRRQRKVHDKLIEKGLQLISDSFLNEVAERCRERDVSMTRQLLEGINYEEIVKETNRGAGQLPSLIGFDRNIADKYDGGDDVRGDVEVDDEGNIVAEDEEQEEKLAGSSGRDYDLLVIGAHGIGRQPRSQLGGVVSRVARGVDKDMLLVREDSPLENGEWMVCVDGSAYSYRAMKMALEMAEEFGAKLYVCSSFDVQYHHAVFNNIKDVLSAQASKVFKFEEQEELHNNVIDKGLLRLSQANIKRAKKMAEEYPDVPLETQVLIGKPFQSILQWADEVEPSMLFLARHGSHRIDGPDLGSNADNLLRMAPCSVMLTGTEDVNPEDVPWIEEDGKKGLEWAPDAEVRIQRVPPFAIGIARDAVEEYVLEHYGPGSEFAAAFVDDWKPGENGGNGTGAQKAPGPGSANGDGEAPQLTREELPVVTNERLDEAIEKLLPTHMQMVMGIGDAEEIARAEVKAEEAMERTVVHGHEDEEDPEPPAVVEECPYTGHEQERERTESDPVVWTHEAFERLKQVPLIPRPLARNTVEKFARERGDWRVTTDLMDENKQAMIDADTFDVDTMLVMFENMKAKQARAEAAGAEGLSPEMKKFIEEAKESGVEKCPIRDVAEEARDEDDCPVDFDMATPDQAEEAIEAYMEAEGDGGEDGDGEREGGSG